MSLVPAITCTFVVNFWVEGVAKTSIKHEHVDQPI